MHILPKGFKKIRFYGFMANRSRKSMLVLCRMLMGVSLSEQVESENLDDTAFLFWKYFRVDITRCPDCESGHIFFIGGNSKGG